MSTANGANYLIPSARKRAQVLSAIQETSCMGFSNLAERRAVTQLAMKLRKLWGMLKSFLVLLLMLKKTMQY